LISGCIQTPPGEEENKTITKNETLAALSHYNLAESYFDSGEYEKAISEYEKVLEYPELDLVDEAHYGIAESYYMLGEYTKAVDEYKNFIRTHPKDDLSVTTQWKIAVIYLKLLNNTVQAEMEYKKLMNNYPDTEETKILRARYKIYSGDYEEAESIVSSVLGIYPKNIVALKLLGRIYLYQGDYQASETEFKKALELKPRSADLLNWLGYVYAQEGIELDEAENLVKEALEINPKSPGILDTLGWVYYKQGRYSEAESIFKKAISLSRNPLFLCLEYYRLGLTYSKLNKTEEAVEEFKKAADYAFNDECSIEAQKELEKLNITS
jgi:tetratricopeptide (TPR) repeat protein